MDRTPPPILEEVQLLLGTTPPSVGGAMSGVVDGDLPATTASVPSEAAVATAPGANQADGDAPLLADPKATAKSKATTNAQSTRENDAVEQAPSCVKPKKGTTLPAAPTVATPKVE